MPDVVAAITTAISLTRQLVEIADATKDAKSKLLIAELSVQLAEVKMRLADLIEENTNLKTQLKRAQSSESEVALKDGVYYSVSGDGPYCTACYDDKKKLIRVTEFEEGFRHFGRFNCPVCDAFLGR